MRNGASAGTAQHTSTVLTGWFRSLHALTAGIEKHLTPMEKVLFDVVLADLAEGLHSCLPARWQHALDIATTWTAEFIIFRLTGPYPFCPEPHYDAAGREFVPDWLNPRYYRQVVLPPAVPTLDQYLEFLEPAAQTPQQAAVPA
ncbi:hypothetical protein JCM10908_004411 [Rhodotorula pacifica]|uniref:uncharacterized protein n=1 Tax=Rhodotorula pacifica TaxID=1495444 RepID=UPI003180278F